MLALQIEQVHNLWSSLDLTHLFICSQVNFMPNDHYGRKLSDFNMKIY